MLADKQGITSIAEELECTPEMIQALADAKPRQRSQDGCSLQCCQADERLSQGGAAADPKQMCCLAPVEPVRDKAPSQCLC